MPKVIRECPRTPPWDAIRESRIALTPGGKTRNHPRYSAIGFNRNSCVTFFRQLESVRDSLGPPHRATFCFHAFGCGRANAFARRREIALAQFAPKSDLIDRSRLQFLIMCTGRRVQLKRLLFSPGPS